jgi:hypothetical protein
MDDDDDEKENEFNNNLHCFYFLSVVLQYSEQSIQNLWQEKNEINVWNGVQYGNP